MQLTISTSIQQSQLDFSRFAFNQAEHNGMPSSAPFPPQDRVELTSEATLPRMGEHSVEHLRQTRSEANDNPLADFLKNILEQITGAQIDDLQNTPAAYDDPSPVPRDGQTSIGAQQADLSMEAASLSLDGSINTSDGAKVSFSLDLQILHASAGATAFNLNTGPNGYEFNFAGSSAELSSTRFSFSLTAEAPDGTPSSGSGVGAFNLKEELKEIRHALKPLIKDFLFDAGMPSDKGSVSRLFRAIA